MQGLYPYINIISVDSTFLHYCWSCYKYCDLSCYKKNSGDKVLSSFLLNRFVIKFSELALQLDFYLLETVNAKCIPFNFCKPVVLLLTFTFVLSIVYLLCNTQSINSLYINLIYLFIKYKQSKFIIVVIKYYFKCYFYNVYNIDTLLVIQ